MSFIKTYIKYNNSSKDSKEFLIDINEISFIEEVDEKDIDHLVCIGAYGHEYYRFTKTLIILKNCTKIYSSDSLIEIENKIKSIKQQISG